MAARFVPRALTAAPNAVAVLAVFGFAVLATLAVLAVLAIPGCARPPDAAALYAAHCRSCHGTDGRGDPRRLALQPGLDLGESPIVLRRLEHRVYRAIYGGGAAMPAFSYKLEHREIEALARYTLDLVPATATEQPERTP